MPLEKAVVDAALARLKKLGCVVIKIHGSPFSRLGEPDLVGSYQGRAFAMEAKKSYDDHPTIAQCMKLLEWKAAGARIGLIRTADEAEAIAIRGEYVGLTEILRIQDETLGTPEDRT
jgi:hypothetical protein